MTVAGVVVAVSSFYLSGWRWSRRSTPVTVRTGVFAMIRHTRQESRPSSGFRSRLLRLEKQPWPVFRAHLDRFYVGFRLGDSAQRAWNDEAMIMSSNDLREPTQQRFCTSDRPATVKIAETHYVGRRTECIGLLVDRTPRSYSVA